MWGRQHQHTPLVKLVIPQCRMVGNAFRQLPHTPLCLHDLSHPAAGRYDWLAHEVRMAQLESDLVPYRVKRRPREQTRKIMEVLYLGISCSNRLYTVSWNHWGTLHVTLRYNRTCCTHFHYWLHWSCTILLSCSIGPPRIHRMYFVRTLTYFCFWSWGIHSPSKERWEPVVLPKIKLFFWPIFFHHEIFDLLSSVTTKTGLVPKNGSCEG